MASIPDDLGAYMLTADHCNEKTYIVFFHSICGELLRFDRGKWDEGRNIDLGQAVALVAAHRPVCKGIQDG